MIGRRENLWCQNILGAGRPFLLSRRIEGYTAYREEEALGGETPALPGNSHDFQRSRAYSYCYSGILYRCATTPEALPRRRLCSTCRVQVADKLLVPISLPCCSRRRKRSSPAQWGPLNGRRLLWLRDGALARPRTPLLVVPAKPGWCLGCLGFCLQEP